jgi:cellulose synthase operon protein C
MRAFRFRTAGLCVLSLSLLLSVGAGSAYADASDKDKLVAVKESAPLADARKKLEATDYEGADAALKALRGADAGEAALMLSRSLFERGKWDEAEKALSQGGAPKTRSATMKARILAARGKNDEAIKLLESVTSGKEGGVRQARLLLGELLIRVGKRSDAGAPLHEVIDDYENIANTDADGLADIGRAAHLLRSAKDANQAYGESEKASKQRVETLLARAELFLEKFDPGHAEELVNDVLKLAPNRADALVLLARIKLDQALDFDAAERLIKAAQKVNPRAAGAEAVLAGIALRDMEITDAEKAIERGFSYNPNDLELHSLKAATRFLADDMPGFEAAKRDVFSRNKEFATFYTIAGEFAEWEHRYDDIVSMMKEAVALDPKDGRAWAQLGLTQMRNGQEQEGMKSLEQSWSKDRFNVMVYNTLNLFEKTIPTAYVSQTVGVFELRYPKSEKDILERYIPGFTAEAFASMKARYNFVPKLPIHLELYETREHFSVRTSGLPNIGIQGVCFGRVVAAMSPKSEPFNWGNVLWHELGHVFAIQMSKNHVPRWFTEGLSEYETIARRPEWDRELDPQLFAALRDKTLPSAVNMNRAFTHASDGLDVTVAYYASSQMLIYTVEKFGMERVAKALRLWGEGKRTADVLRGAFGVEPGAYDEGFRAWAMARLTRYNGQFMFSEKPIALELAAARLKEKPNDPSAHTNLALSLLSEHKIEDAQKEIAAALKLSPGHGPANYLSAKIALGQKKPKDALGYLDTLRKAGLDGYAIRTSMADAFELDKNAAKQKHSLEAAHRFDPSQTEPLESLFDLAVEEKRDDDQLEALRKLAPLDQHNRRAWRGLLVRLFAKKAYQEAKEACTSALYVDVENAEIHQLCAETHQALGDVNKAVFEAESALLSTPKPKDAKAAHLLLAQLLKKKNPKEAEKHTEEAGKLTAP